MTSGRIQRRLLASLMALVAAALIPAALLLEQSVGEAAQAQVREALLRHARTLATELERAPPKDLSGWTRALRGAADARVTVIGRDGLVLADSDVSPEALAVVENHRARREVSEALAGRAGAAVRRSTTVGSEMMYLAVPVGDSSGRVLRVALPLDQVAASVRRARTSVWLAALLASAIALGLGFWFSRSFTRPVLALTVASRAMADGDFGVALPPPPQDELGELIHAVDRLRSQLAARIDQLQREGVKLRTILDGMSEGVALVQDGRIAVANPNFARLLEATDPVEGRPPIEVARIPALAEVLSAAPDDTDACTREASLGERVLGIHAQRLEGEGSPRVVVITDLTEARRLERLRREFVANASHELRTPVAAIVGVAETLASDAADDPLAFATFVPILLRHGQRLSRLTADLLDLARLEAGYRPRVESVELAQAAATCAATLGPRAADKRVAIELDVPPSLRVLADAAAVEQILANLVDNAIKYTPAEGTVRVSARPLAEAVELIVSDTGAGISAAHLPRLFERFYRVDAARSRELGGTGLGLAIVKHLAMANGGAVSVESQLGAGSRFAVCLPAG